MNQKKKYWNEQKFKNRIIPRSIYGSNIYVWITLPLSVGLFLVVCIAGSFSCKCIQQRAYNPFRLELGGGKWTRILCITLSFLSDSPNPCPFMKVSNLQAGGENEPNVLNSILELFGTIQANRVFLSLSLPALSLTLIHFQC